MKSYREIADSVFARREQYVTAQRKRKKLLASAGATLCAVSLLGGSVWYLNRPQHDIPVTPASDDDAVTTTVTTAPTEQDVTTTTANTPATETTTDGGVVAPTTTVTTVAPTQTTAKPTTGKTEPPKTTTPSKTESTKTTATTATKHKLVISGDEPDANCAEVSEAGVYKHGVISPLLKETMEQYKDVDDVDVLYAVVVAVRYKVADDYEAAYNALLESDEMVELAERRDLAYEEWKAADAENYYRKREAYLTLRREYDKKVKDFRDAHRNAGLNESLALLSQFSDIDLMPLKDRLKPDMDWSEEFPIRCALILSEYEKHAYVAVLSADEILELSERIGCMYWLDSYDDDFYIPGMLDE